MSRSRTPGRQRLLAVLATLMATLVGYVMVEVSYSTLYVHGFVVPQGPVWLFQRSDRSIHFDPVRGYRLSQTPTRVAKLAEGIVEFDQPLVGNAQGFVDRDDFSPQADDRSRWAVLGDSFTAAEYLAHDWTERVEDANPALDLLNFSVSGAGLANWWHIAQHYLAPQKIALDGLIFAVFEGDLHRSFTFADHSQGLQHRWGRAPSWDPTTWPQTLQDAEPLLQTGDGYILSEAAYTRALEQRWLPEAAPPWRPYAALTLFDWLRRAHAFEVPAELQPAQWTLVDDLAQFATDHSLAVLVVAIPSRESLIAGRTAPDDVRAFARRFDARFLDGSDAFTGLDADAIRAHWLPYDGHWGQRGSDRFAAWLEAQLH